MDRSEMNNLLKNNDTICAISTPHGMGGIAVIRVSGKDAISIVSKCWKGCDLSTATTHTAHLGKILFSDGEILDEVVLTIFRAPHTFTGEDVIEIACHGSMWIQQQILNRLIDAGCRAATGGEFTQRAFFNGRIDLSQAEAIADVIASSSRASHRIAISQMRGAFSRELSSLREQLLHFVSLIELELDFSEEEVEFADRSKLIDLATEIASVINRLASSFSAGNVIKNGLPVAIVGETNAGKSTLLNQLLHDDRALVSDIHGTTRDVIEDTITIQGRLFRFIDTAGIRQTTDTIESMGIERTFKKLEEAQLALWVIDGNTPCDEIKTLGEKIVKLTTDKPIIAIVNKVDTLTDDVVSEITKTLNETLPNEAKHIFISARDGVNLNELQHLLLSASELPQADSNEVIITNARHYQALTLALGAINRAIEGLQNGISGDFVSQDIRESMHYLGEITGEITTHDILGNIFAHFCIGK